MLVGADVEQMWGKPVLWSGSGSASEHAMMGALLQVTWTLICFLSSSGGSGGTGGEGWLRLNLLSLPFVIVEISTLMA